MFRHLVLLSLCLLSISAAPSSPFTPFVKPTNISKCLYPAGKDPMAPTCFDNPNTTVREFTLVFDNMQLPGFPKQLISINGTYPGPTLIMNQFEIIVIHVVNNMPEPTSLHIHGARQYKSPHMDGVPSLTQCPIGPQSNFTYRFCADRSGTFWYHAHHNEHIVDGMFGAIIVRPQPYGEVYASQYDTEIPILVSDFYNQRGNSMIPHFLSPQSLGFEPVPEQFVLNGRFAGQTAWAFDRSKKLRLRLINSGAFAMFTVSVDAMAMTVIEIDGTDVEPLVVTSLSLSVAQRVSILLDLSQVDSSISAINIHCVANPAMFDPDLITNGAVFDVSAAIFLCDASHKTGMCANPITSSIVDMQQPKSFEPGFMDYPSGQYNQPFYTVSAPKYMPDSPAIDFNLLNAKPLYPAYRDSNSASCYKVFNSDITKVDAIVPMVLGFANDVYAINRGQWNGITYYPAQQTSNLYMQPMAAPQPLLYNTIQASQAYSTMLSNVSLSALSSPTPYANESAAITDPQALPKGLGGMYPDSFLTNASYTFNMISPNQIGQYILPANSTIEFIVINTDTGLHPIHLHGYAPYIISSSEYPDGEKNNYGNYPLRDVWNIPGNGGWVKIRIVTDNPGVWIFHCHISWHLEAGLAAVFIDNIEALQTDPYYSNGTLIPQDHLDTCSNYNPPIPAALVNLCQVFKDNDGFNFKNSPATQTRWAMVSDLIIISEAIFGWIVYKLGILNYILPELIGINIGTWVGVVFIEILKESFEQVFEAKTLEYRNVVIVMCIGFLFPLTMEKFIKRGRSNKFKFLTQQQQKPTEDSDSSNPASQTTTTTNAKGGLLHSSRALQHASSQVELVTPRQAASSNVDITPVDKQTFKDEEKGGIEMANASNSIKMANAGNSIIVTFHGHDPAILPQTFEAPQEGQSGEGISSVKQDDTMSKQDDVIASPVIISSKQDDPDIVSKQDDSMSSPDILSSKQDLVADAEPTPKKVKAEKRGSGMERIAQALASKDVDYTLIAIIVLGEMVDTFVDGGIIAAAYLAGTSVGISTTVGVFMEELPRLTGSFAVFVSAGAPAWKCMLINVLSSCAFLVGSGFIMGIASNPNVNPQHIYYLLPYAAGSFLYVALVDLTPILTNMPWPGYPRAITQILSVMFGIGIQAAIGVYQWKTKTT